MNNSQFFMYPKILENLEAWRTSVGRKPLILKGARQVGKTYILREWAESTFASTHYINFESNQGVAKVFESDLDVRRMLADLALYVGHCDVVLAISMRQQSKSTITSSKML